MNLVYVVQSVPSRADLRKRLLAQIPPAVVIEDDGPPPPSPWRGYRLCLEMVLESKATHGVILQDDTIVCHHFATAVYKIAKAHPDLPICLFVSGSRTKTLRNYTRAVRSQNRYSSIWFQDYCPVVAMLWPRVRVEEFLEWYAGDPKIPMNKPYRSDDAVVGSWMKFTKQTVLATVPSIVEHPDDTLSVKWHESKVPSGTGNKRRRAFMYIGDADPLELDWTNV